MANSIKSDPNCRLDEQDREGDKIETEGTEYPTCPHCGFSDQDWWDGLDEKKDGDSWHVCCGSCGKDYEARIFISYSFDTKVEDTLKK